MQQLPTEKTKYITSDALANSLKKGDLGLPLGSWVTRINGTDLPQEVLEQAVIKKSHGKHTITLPAPYCFSFTVSGSQVTVMRLVAIQKKSAIWAVWEQGMSMEEHSKLYTSLVKAHSPAAPKKKAVEKKVKKPVHSKEIQALMAQINSLNATFERVLQAG